ncbi:hypothetical protein FPOAC2_06135 [Fusarium poae]|jgi:3-carboxy-cis,cis-muconate cycloisomerase
MMRLAELFGRQEAHEILYGVYQAAVEESLRKIDKITQHLSTEQLLLLIGPTNYLGCPQLMVDELLGLNNASLKRNASKNGMNGINGVVDNIENGYH